MAAYDIIDEAMSTDYTTEACFGGGFDGPAMADAHSSTNGFPELSHSSTMEMSCGLFDTAPPRPPPPPPAWRVPPPSPAMEVAAVRGCDGAGMDTPLSVQPEFCPVIEEGGLAAMPWPC
jgi:hypothetical protein